MAIQFPQKKGEGILSKIAVPAASLAGGAVGSAIPGVGTAVGAGLGSAIGGAIGGVAKGVITKDPGLAAGGLAQGVQAGASGMNNAQGADNAAAMQRRLASLEAAKAPEPTPPPAAQVSPQTATIREGMEALQGLPGEYNKRYSPILGAAYNKSLRRDFGGM